MDVKPLPPEPEKLSPPPIPKPAPVIVEPPKAVAEPKPVVNPPAEKPATELVVMSDVLKDYDITEQQIKTLVCEDKLKAYRMAGCYLFKEADLLKIAKKKAPPPPPPPPHVVEFRKVTKTYKGSKPYTAIKDVSFVVEDLPEIGELVAILGPSGCGKSTVLKLIAGLEPQHPATEGEVLVLGKPVIGPGADRGMVFQEYTAFDNRTVVDNVAFGLECRGMAKKPRREQAMHWIEKVGLNPAKDADKFPHQLSGGMRQRVAIARSLILNPRILLMDEPFGALDPMTRFRMQDLLINLWKDSETTVFFVTHDIPEAVFLGDRVYLFSNAPGTIIEEVPSPRPTLSAVDAREQPDFQEKVKNIRTKIAKMEAEKGVV